ncbi:MAG TPA: FtsX-like permease family protein, partial [Moraxellaceae bacterium]|nr:FtsX-like permease family protein [Moraxellaceae bacterium]
LIWIDGDWRAGQGTGGVSVYVTGISAQGNGILFDQVLTPTQKELLQQPMAVIVDRSSLDQLAVAPGDTAWIDGHAVRVVAAVSGLRALGGVNVITSLESAREIAPVFRDAGQATYLVARLRQPGRAEAVGAALKGQRGFGPYDVWTADEFARKSQLFWMLDTGAGVAVLFLGGIVFLVGVVIASQALAAVVIGSAREYATLNALGVGRRALRLVVLEQSAWIGGLGLLVAALLAALLLTVAQQHDVPVGMSVPVALMCAALIFLLSLASGLFAMRGLMRADPALLLR